LEAVRDPLGNINVKIIYMKKKVTKKKPKGLKFYINKMDKYYHRYIRLRDTDSEGKGKCITCEVPLDFKRIQAGHLIGREHKSVRWNELNTYGQCARCNCWGCGEQLRMALKVGLPLAKKLLKLSEKPWKTTPAEYEVLIAYWKEKCEAEEAKKTFL
jgi:hypothetical protein